MLYNQVWAESEKDLLVDFSSQTKLDATAIYEEDNFLCVVVLDRCEITIDVMKDLVGSIMGHQVPMIIAYQKSFYEFTKISTKPLSVIEKEHGCECKLVLHFRCVVRACGLN